MTAKDYIHETEREVAQWPGASCAFRIGGKHNVAVVEYGGQSRQVVFAGSPSDAAHGLKNHIGVVRKELRTLGAEREIRRKSPHRDRQRNKPTRGPLQDLGAAPVRDDPFAQLLAIRKALPPCPAPTPEPARLTLWQRIVAWWRA